jgi:hypothetical protein
LKHLYKKRQLRFHDADAFVRNISQGTLEHCQFEPGKFSGELVEIIFEHVIISTHKMNRTLLQIGFSLNGFTVCESLLAILYKSPLLFVLLYFSETVKRTCTYPLKTILI